MVWPISSNLSFAQLSCNNLADLFVRKICEKITHPTPNPDDRSERKVKAQLLSTIHSGYKETRFRKIQGVFRPLVEHVFPSRLSSEEVSQSFLKFTEENDMSSITTDVNGKEEVLENPWVLNPVVKGWIMQRLTRQLEN